MLGRPGPFRLKATTSIQELYDRLSKQNTNMLPIDHKMIQKASKNVYEKNKESLLSVKLLGGKRVSIKTEEDEEIEAFKGAKDKKKLEKAKKKRKEEI